MIVASRDVLAINSQILLCSIRSLAPEKGRELIIVVQHCVTAVSKWMSDIHPAMFVFDVVVLGN